MKKLLSLPTWVFFVLFFAVPLAVYSSKVSPVLLNLLGFVWTGGVVYLANLLGHKLYTKLPARHDLNFTVFRISMWAVFIGTPLICLSAIFPTGEGWLYFWLILGCITGLGFFIATFFIAKLIATIEDGGSFVDIEAYIFIAFGLLLLPIGIWWILPKIKRIFSADAPKQPSY